MGEIHHIDGDPHNNDPSNLKLVTRGRELEKKADDWIRGGYGGPVQMGLIVDLLAEVRRLKGALEPFAHIASRFEEWGIGGEEVTLRLEYGHDVLTEIFTRPFIQARQLTKRLYP